MCIARPNEDIADILNLDSFDLLNSVIGLHEQPGVEIAESDYGKLNTLNYLISYLQTRAE